MHVLDERGHLANRTSQGAILPVKAASRLEAQTSSSLCQRPLGHDRRITNNRVNGTICMHAHAIIAALLLEDE